MKSLKVIECEPKDAEEALKPLLQQGWKLKEVVMNPHKRHFAAYHYLIKEE